LKNPFRDGTTHVLFSPEDFIARLVARVPRPRLNPTRNPGVFAPSSPMRHAVVPTPAPVRQRRRAKDAATAQATRQQPAAPATDNTGPPTAPLTSTQRLKRVFDIDITLCPLCRGQFATRIADVPDPDLIRKTLAPQQASPPHLPPGRAEPHQTLPDVFATR
jgi:hypothetical protein